MNESGLEKTSESARLHELAARSFAGGVSGRLKELDPHPIMARKPMAHT
jgi:hypothetical protein